MANKPYKPNFTDPRVLRRIQASLDWVNTYLSVNNPRPLANRQIQKEFGAQTRPLARWLRAKLLIKVDLNFNKLTGQCQTYTLNLEGYNQVCDAIGYTPKFKSSQEIQMQVESGQFEYTEKSDRSFTALQFIRKEIRNAYLFNNGYKYHYDIEAAAPTLLYQRAEKLALVAGLEFDLPYLKAYIDNRSQVRNQISDEATADCKQVKSVINALLQGGRLSAWNNNQTFREINSDYDLLKRLKKSETLTNLLGDFKKLWQILRNDLPVRYLTDCNGRHRRVALSGRDKSGYYRSLEKQVGDVIRRYLKNDSVRHLWIHDGWSCDRIIDDVELCAEVRRQTGFVIKLDRELFDQESSY